MIELLTAFANAPAPFEVHTARQLWTDPHIASRMLRAHLDPDSDRASRRPGTIDAEVRWLDDIAPLAGRIVYDLGCGPGLYASRFHHNGAAVTGFDWSESSLAYARAQADRKGHAIRYVNANYTEATLPGNADLITMICGDFCVLAPQDRARLLKNVHQALKPGGRFAFDVYTTFDFDQFRALDIIEPNLMGGFWSPDDYVGLMKGFKYPDALVTLERYLIINGRTQRQFYNWLQYFSVDSITAALADAGFSVETIAGSLSGERLESNSRTFGVIAGRADSN